MLKNTINPIIVQPFLHLLEPDQFFPGDLTKIKAAINDDRRLVLSYTPPDLTLYAVSRESAATLRQLTLDKTRVHAMGQSDPVRFNDWTQNRLLVDRESALSKGIHPCIEIEINRHCNFRCVYCPVAKRPKPKGFMAEETYDLVLKRVKDYGAKTVSLNHYSEPTLDPNLVSRVQKACNLGLKVNISTNASMLNRETIKDLAKLPGLRFRVNLPSVDEAQYKSQTGSKLFFRVMENLELLHTHKICTNLSINTDKQNGSAAVRDINQRFAAMFGKSVQWASDDRAGALDNGDYAPAARHRGRLNGCSVIQGQLNVSYKGEIFLCCQDFDQRYVFGDLHHQNINEIKSSQKFQRTMSWILGLAEPPDDFICSRCAWTQEATPLKFGSASKTPGQEELTGLLKSLPIRYIND